MSVLDELIRYESANSGLAFREQVYSQTEARELVIDIVALANASVSGSRFLVLGVRDVVGGQRTLTGVSKAEFDVLKKLIRRLISGAVEPAFKIAVKTLMVDDSRIGVVIVSDCDNRPYLFTAEAGGDFPPGSGWVRRGTQQLPLQREDLQRMFEAKFTRPKPKLDLRIGFPGSAPQNEITLRVLPLDELPSDLAAGRLRKMLEAKANAKEILGKTETQFSRLMHAQVFGMDEPYEARGEDTLKLQLERTAAEYARADEFYKYEVRAHQLDLVVAYDGESSLSSAMLQLKLPRLEGMGIAKHLYYSTERETDGDSYPEVDEGSHTIGVQTRFGSVQPGTMVKVFRQAPRIWMRQPAAGKTIPVDCTVHAPELSEPVHQTLIIRIVAAR